MGRPSKLTPEVQDRLIQALEAGNYYEAACGYAGVRYQTFRNWMVRGEAAQSGQFFEFFEAVRGAESRAEATIVAQWRQQIPDNWQAARDFLARRHPDRWGAKDKHTITIDDRRQLEQATRDLALARGLDPAQVLEEAEAWLLKNS